MALALTTTTRNAMLNQIVTAIGTSGFIDIYNGTRPASGGTATTLLAHLALSATSAPGAASGVLTFSTITADTAADATGTATWFRATTSAGVWAIDGNVGTSGADLNLNTTAIVIGGPVAITSFTITDANA